MKEFIDDLMKVESFVKKEAAQIIGKEAVNHFTENFDDQSFDGKKWEDVKRRDSKSTWYGNKQGANSNVPSNHPKRKGAKGKYKRRKEGSKTNFSPTATKTPILSSQKSELENSLNYEVKGGQKVVISSDKPYADVHNEGGKIKVYGKKTVDLPERKFVGDSPQLDKKIKTAIDKKLKF